MLGLGLLQTIAFPSISADTEYRLAVGPIGMMSVIVSVHVFMVYVAL